MFTNFNPEEEKVTNVCSSCGGESEINLSDVKLFEPLGSGDIGLSFSCPACGGSVSVFLNPKKVTNKNHVFKVVATRLLEDDIDDPVIKEEIKSRFIGKIKELYKDEKEDMVKEINNVSRSEIVRPRDRVR